MVAGKGRPEPDTGAAQTQPPVRAWVAASAIDARGARCDSPKDSALNIIAVSVHERYAPGIKERVALMCDVARGKQIPQGTASLWVYPAGYFGFNASTITWPGVDPSELHATLPKILEAHPAGAWVAFGVDLGGRDQQVWLIHGASAASGGGPVLHKIEHKVPSLAARCLDLDGNGLKAAFFVCGEIATYEGQLSDCRLIVDLAHMRIPGTVRSQHASPRWVHQRLLTTASAHGAAVLVHHHAGEHTKAEGEHFRHQSNWILFRGDGTDWLDRAEVVTIPWGDTSAGQCW